MRNEKIKKLIEVVRIDEHFNTLCKYGIVMQKDFDGYCESLNLKSDNNSDAVEEVNEIIEKLADDISFDINLYTALVVLASQTKNPITICEEDLYDFAEMDMDFKTGIIDATTPDVNIGGLYPHEYADIYTEWITEAVIRYNKMRNKYLAGEQ